MKITTKYLGATNYKGERISVNVGGQMKYYPYNYAYNPLENHTKNALKAMKDLNKSHRQQFDLNRTIKQYDYESTATGYIFDVFSGM